MVIAALAILGLALGSFVNALVWRIHEQAKPDAEKKVADSLSVLKGRSMCPHCRHQLAIKDLIPVISWLMLGGKCRYCGQPISWQYPLVELATAALFVISYLCWPSAVSGWQIAAVGLWLIVLTGFVALIISDLRWYLLPDRIVFPLSAAAVAFAIVNIVSSDQPLKAVGLTALAVIIGGGIFYIIFQLSEGKWIGGGDVKLGFLLGLIAGTPARSILIIFIASVLGCLVSLPLLASGRLKKTHVIPFGPFLIVAAIIVQLFGADILDWYKQTFINI